MASATKAPAPRPGVDECRQSLCTNLSWLLSQAAFALGTELSTAFAGIGLTPRAHVVLEAAQSGEHTQSELADAVGLDKTTMVVTVDELEAAGLAERRPSATDRRVRVIAVTPAGRRKVKQGQALIASVQEDVLGELPADQRGPFLESLVTLVRSRLAEPVGCAMPARRKQPRPM
jgi:DNA-binding MarR family transcriptional regulator